MNSNDLTLAICLYNAERYIEETLGCIINQTFQDFDLLIVDDCSTDHSMAVVDRFFARHPRQHRIMRLAENQGICAGRSLAERTAKTKYMMFVDADDSPYPSLVEKLHAKICSDADLMAVGCYLQYMDGEGHKLSGGIFIGETHKEGFYKKAGCKKLIFMQPTAIYDRCVALSAGGYQTEGFPPGRPRYRDYCEDMDLWTRMSDLYVEGKAIVVVPEILCRYRKHENGLSTNSLNMVLRMKHAKTNLLRRRSGRAELTFAEFHESLSGKELARLKRDSIVADSLRNGVFYLKKRNLAKGGYLVAKSIVMNPVYFVQKLKSNSGMRTKKRYG